MPFCEFDGVRIVFDDWVWENLAPDKIQALGEKVYKELGEDAEKGRIYQVNLQNITSQIPKGFKSIDINWSANRFRKYNGQFIPGSVIYKKYSSNRLTNLYSRLKADISDSAGLELATIKAKLLDEGVSTASDIFNEPLNIDKKKAITKNIIINDEGIHKLFSSLYLGSVIGTAFGLMYGNTLNNERDGLMATITPEAIVGPVPLYSIQSIERSRSDRIVKYRAIGDVFLAHQQGTKDSLRIDGTLTGHLRNLYLVMLQTLQDRGEQRLEAIKNISEDAVKSLEIEPAGTKEVEPMYELHETIPIITRTSVMLDMYLQTIEWHQSVEDGMECIKYHLLFRKYIKPTGWQALSTDIDDIKKFNIDYRKTITERRRMECLYDMVWKTIKMGTETYYGTWTGGKSGADWVKETVSYAPYLFLTRMDALANITRAEMFGKMLGG